MTHDYKKKSQTKLDGWAVRSAKANSEYEPATRPVNPPADGFDAIMAVCSDCYRKQKKYVKKKEEEKMINKKLNTEGGIKLKCVSS